MPVLGWLTGRTVALGVVAVAATLAGMSRYAQAPLPVTKVDMTGKVAIVTGASAGIGKETARTLADWGAHVIMACRDEKKGARVLADIKNTTGSDQVEVWKLDLASFASVRAFAERFVRSKLPLHLLINNAGLVMDQRKLTEDGHELTYQTNHLGHFLLTKLLLPPLLSSAPSRAIQVSSDGHYIGKVPFDNLDREKGYGMSLRVYADSKLMNVLFANELNRRYEAKGLSSSSVHPGFVRTEFTRNTKGFFKSFIEAVGHVVARDEYQGALTTIYAATHPDAKGGKYYSSCKATKPNSQALNETLAAELWRVSEETVKQWSKPI